ncbi:translation initiation factor aIF-2 [Aphanomyces invadans]|uniref:Eukaryotic translation initiation factor 5B n=1 Tax=Aphanomyces invadans TaxID=157072 RepID=A0A024UUI2_9STRA|nr:translation initiation factor aIF-2 [Aphanomyces invadans]ETW09615.1 translation initiation factor aIF-2 [Aphanomyces invadans]|eukprot:XP_008861026.1 translation initiation factor aIF-2 [Aphanomyces invadans]
MPPKKGKKAAPAKKTGGADDEWDDVLNEFATTTKVDVPPPAPVQAPVAADKPDTSVDDAVAAALASMGISAADAADKKKNKKKDKKKKDGDKADAPAATAAAPVAETKGPKKPLSAAAKALQERQAALKAEEERLKKIQEEEDRKFREAEEARLEAIRKKEELAERKRLAKKAKVDAQKADGTYMTKAQKEKAKRAQAALEAMKAQGLIEIAAEGGGLKPKVTYDNKKKPKAAIKEEEAKPCPAVVEVDAPDAWDASDDEDKEQAKGEADDEEEDDWDAKDWDDDEVLDKIGLKVQEADYGDVEDLIEVERLKEQERLREQGLALAKRQAEQEAENAKAAEEERNRSKLRQEEDRKKREAAERRRIREDEARAAVSLDNLRSPICCIMGHVDTGKTKLLDNIRRTKVQDGEAGGITQQIGATFFPVDAIKQKTAELSKTMKLDFKLPGLLVIDTPGHESFTNLRSRGSSLCDIAILVVDIMHGLEPQTLESIRLLRAKRAPFVVALNKIDRCYSWKTCPDMPFLDAFQQQNEHVQREFEDRAAQIKVQFAEQKLNAELYYRNNDLGRTISLIPTSAISGEGVPDLLGMLVRLTQEKMAKSLAFVDILQCTVLEVKVIEGLGTTIDTILVNGSLSEGQTIVVCTLDGPVVTTIRSLLTPHPMKEIRVKGEYVHHQTIQAAMGVKICAQGLEKAVAGTAVHVVGPDDDVNELKDAVMSDLSNIMDSVQATKRGVMVQASTLGALEALLEFLRNGCDPPIPVACVNIGPVHKKDVMRASVQLEHQKEFATILAFDVKVQNDAADMANELGVRIFTADIIYHLFDQFTAYMDNIRQLRREQFADIAVFPVVLKIIPTCIFNKKDPIILGVDVEEGILKVGTPLVSVTNGVLVSIGRVASIERDNKTVETAKKGSNVAVKIESDSNVTYGRQFDHTHKLYSHLSRASIDALKENFKDDLGKDDWRLVIKLKPVFGII